MKKKTKLFTLALITLALASCNFGNFFNNNTQNQVIYADEITLDRSSASIEALLRSNVISSAYIT